MELPAYHMPTAKNLLRTIGERAWSFIKKAGTVILLSSVVIWFTTYFGFIDGGFRMLSDEEVSHSILAYIGKGISWLFIPLGLGKWQMAVASVTGLVAKENIVASLSVVYGGASGISEAFTSASGLSFLVFNLLCAPCFAAVGAIRREMNSAKWTAFALGYQCLFAYAAALVAYNAVLLFSGNVNIIGSIVSVLVLGFVAFMLARPAKDAKGNRIKL
jgi:ferrous iron transport protein B